MVSYLDMFIKGIVSKLVVPKMVYLPNGDTTQVTHVGSCALSDKSIISNVFYLPKFKYNLMSVSKLTKELDCLVTFFPNFYIFQNLYSIKVKEVCKEASCLYTQSHDRIEKEIVLAVNQVSSNMELWHQRLGHVSSIVLSKIFDMNNQSMCKVSKCLVCPYAKQTRLTFPSNSIKICNCFDLIHVDLWGPYSTLIFYGIKYFLTIVSDFSIITWLFLLKYMYNVCASLKMFLQYVNTQFDGQVKVIKSDNGTEFVILVCTTMFNALGIIHERSCPYSPQKNEVVARKHIHLFDVSRDLRYQGKIPLKFQGHCVLVVAYLTKFQVVLLTIKLLVKDCMDVNLCGHTY